MTQLGCDVNFDTEVEELKVLNRQVGTAEDRMSGQKGHHGPKLFTWPMDDDCDCNEFIEMNLPLEEIPKSDTSHTLRSNFQVVFDAPSHLTFLCERGVVKM